MCRPFKDQQLLSMNVVSVSEVKKMQVIYDHPSSTTSNTKITNYNYFIHVM